MTEASLRPNRVIGWLDRVIVALALMIVVTAAVRLAGPTLPVEAELLATLEWIDPATPASAATLRAQAFAGNGFAAAYGAAYTRLVDQTESLTQAERRLILVALLSAALNDANSERHRDAALGLFLVHVADGGLSANGFARFTRLLQRARPTWRHSRASPHWRALAIRVITADPAAAPGLIGEWPELAPVAPTPLDPDQLAPPTGPPAQVGSEPGAC